MLSIRALPKQSFIVQHTLDNKSEGTGLPMTRGYTKVS